MLIANPIYDSVFKYLLDDNSVAKLFLSLILDKEIIELELKPTELKTATDIDAPRFLTVFMIDFKAKIRNLDGSEEIVIIEIQKAKLATDIMRFRKYLGSQYSDDNNIYQKENEFDSNRALPIISIYFLGHKLEHTQAPIIKVNREYIDISTKEKILEKEEFIECLTHDSYIIQIPYLKQKRQTEILQVLSVFDQDNKASDKHILNVNADDLPEKYRIIIRRLQKAMAEEELKRKMDVEDLILQDMQNSERKMSVLEKTIKEQMVAIEEKEKALKEQNRALQIAIDFMVSQGMSRDEAEAKLF